MDVGELLRFKPSKNAKRQFYDDEDDEEENTTSSTPQAKRLAIQLTPREKSLKERVSVPLPVPIPDAASKILEAIEEGADETATFDEATLKKLLLKFEKKVSRNQELRIKFGDIPEKFMMSEIELHDVIQEMHVVPTQPDFYHILIDLSCITTILGLLSHENTDISVAVVDLIQELTDFDNLEENQENAVAITEALLEGQIVALLVQNMERLDEASGEEAQGVHNSLAIIENISEIKPEFAQDCGQQGLIQWLLKRVKSKHSFDSNKLYASEILSIILQSNEDNKKILGENDGIDVLLQQLAHFKRHDPSNNDEEETMENLFNCLCSSLLYVPNKERFLQGEGLQLMNLILREKKQSRSGALKVLNYAMNNPGGTDNCNKFVDILGLRTVFPLFMKTPKRPKKKGLTYEDHEEHTLSILASMLKNCKGPQRQRLINKFTENDHEKVDRLMELHFKYQDKVHLVDNQIEKEKAEHRYNDEEIDDSMSDEYYIRRLEAGLFTLQLISYIIIDICSCSTTSIKQRVLQTLNLRGGTIKNIRNIMREYIGNLGSEEDSTSKELEKQHVQQLIDRF